MKDEKDQIDEMIEDTLEEYFDLVGASLPTGTGVSYDNIGPFSQYVNSATGILDRILDIVNDDVSELDKLDVQEFLYNSVPKLLNKIDTVCDAIERKTGYKSLQRTRQKPLTPPQNRSNTKVKIK
jgi:hypothetical protein|tara:strand:+ start:376 stop:750 length:375 start_codon:yes stop_codon:yes gene_type:complete